MLLDELETLAKLKFNLSALKPFQQAIISDFMHGHDILIISPTGSGKSLCYQLPALLLPGTFIIISPLIALMQDQVYKLKQKNIEAEFLHAELSREEQKEILDKVQNQKTKLLYISPERLLQNSFLSFLKQQQISGFAIDEVHCMLQWGQDFRPEYQGLSKLKNIFPNVTIMALTATANPKQQQQIIQELKLSAKKHIHSIHRQNIAYEVINTGQTKANLEMICQKHSKQSGIIYTASRQRVDSIYQFLKDKGYPVLRYHAGMSVLDKNEQMNQFIKSDSNIMIATIAFGMGVDKSNIRFVLHLDVPGRFDQLIQEIGRVGRDGLNASSYLLFHSGNFLQFNLWRIQKSHPKIFEEQMNELQIMSQFLYSSACFETLIAKYFEDIHKDACGKCQRCLHKTPTTIPTEDVLKLLSCIYRLQNNANLKLIIDVMQGINPARTKEFEHLSTFGIGQHQTASYWQSLVCFLFSKNLITIQDQNSMAWHLTSQGVLFLKTQPADILNYPLVAP